MRIAAPLNGVVAMIVVRVCVFGALPPVDVGGSESPFEREVPRRHRFSYLGPDHSVDALAFWNKLV